MLYTYNSLEIIYQKFSKKNVNFKELIIFKNKKLLIYKLIFKIYFLIVLKAKPDGHDRLNHHYIKSVSDYPHELLLCWVQVKNTVYTWLKALYSIGTLKPSRGLSASFNLRASNRINQWIKWLVLVTDALTFRDDIWCPLWRIVVDCCALLNCCWFELLFWTSWPTDALLCE